MDGYPNPAQWITRTERLVHGALVSAERFVTGPNPLGPSKRIWIELAETTLLVPVVVVSFVRAGAAPASQDHSDEFRALFDFIPPHLSVAGRHTRPAGDLLDPARIQLPPDDIWAQCGIQFQVIDAFVVPMDSGWIIPCARGYDGQRNFMPDARLVEKLVELYGDERVLPLFEAVGQTYAPAFVVLEMAHTFPPSDCNLQFYGRAVPGRMIELDYRILHDVRPTTAHELGHVLLGPNHSSIAGNLMLGGGGPSDLDLSPEQCRTARASAKPLSDKYRALNVVRGHAAPPSASELPPIFNVGDVIRAPGVLSPGPNEPTYCCNVGNQFLKTSSFVCELSGGSRAAENACKVCCIRSVSPPDAAWADPETCSQPINALQCDPVQCSIQPNTCISRYACEQQGGNASQCARVF
jgi:hypothetical protein